MGNSRPLNRRHISTHFLESFKTTSKLCANFLEKGIWGWLRRFKSAHLVPRDIRTYIYINQKELAGTEISSIILILGLDVPHSELDARTKLAKPS